jgi:hypothetical protein
MPNKYSWKIESFAKGLSPTAAARELTKIEKKYGALTPDTLLKASIKKDSVFHNLFEWNDTLAAEKWRLQQARTIINNIEIIVLSDGAERNISAYEIIRHDEGSSYKRVDTFTADDKEQVRKRTLMELSSIRSKLAIYKEFDFAVIKIDEASEVLQGV